MRVAYVCADPGVGVLGTKGCSVHVREVLRALVHRGAEVELFCRRTGDAREPAPPGVRVHELPRPSGATAADRERACLRADEEMMTALDAAGPFDLVYERYSLFSRAGMTYARRAEVPGILEVNAPLIDEQAAYRGLVHREEATAVIEDAADAADVVLAVSEQVAGWLRGLTGDANILVQGNGVDVDRIRPAARPRDGSGFTVGFVGTLKPWHGLDVLLDGFAGHRHGHPDSRLVVVGDGPLRSHLADRVRALDLPDSVTLTGAVRSADVPALLHRMDVAVAPYPADAGHYFSPLKVYEYLAAGLTVVASRVGQLTSVLTDDHDAVLVPPGDHEALAGQLTALAGDPGRRKRLGRAARQTAQLHTWDAVVARTLAAAGVRQVTGGV